MFQIQFKFSRGFPINVLSISQLNLWVSLLRLKICVDEMSEEKGVVTLSIEG